MGYPLHPFPTSRIWTTSSPLASSVPYPATPALRNFQPLNLFEQSKQHEDITEHELFKLSERSKLPVRKLLHNCSNSLSDSNPFSPMSEVRILSIAQLLERFKPPPVGPRPFYPPSFIPTG
jgi:hypothetical protein